jgi:hypothetical protein
MAAPSKKNLPARARAAPALQRFADKRQYPVTLTPSLRLPNPNYS